MKNLIQKVGLDKFAHLGIGGLLCAVMSDVLVLQDGIISWDALFYSVAASVVVFLFSVFKEYVIDESPDWADIWAAMIGCAVYAAGLAAGIGLFVASH